MKRIVTPALLAIFAAQFGIADLILRRPPMRVWIPCAIASAAVWVLVASLVRGRARGLSAERGARAAVAMASAALLVLQVLFFRYYHVFFDDDGMLAARHMWSDVRPVLMRMLPFVCVVTALAAGVEYACLSYVPRIGKWPRIGAATVFAIALVAIPHLRDGSPDVSAIWALRLVMRPADAHAAADVQVPVLSSRRARLPNVLVILDESVRATDYNAETTPETTALTAGRVELREMRSVASYTAIAVSSLLTSRPPTERALALDHAPYLFDFVRAVRRASERVHVGYYSAQTDSLFERRDVRSATDAFVTVDDLVGHRVDDLDDVIDLGVDNLLATRVERDLPKLEKPFLAIVHLSGTHAPYYVDDARAPFKPYRHTPAWSGLGELHTAYRDAIFDQDAAVARTIRAFFAAVGDDPALIVFTSDHGEAFGEHAAIHHGQSLYDEQIHVPAWVLSKNDALDETETRALAAHENDFVTHLDVVPTLLDAYGVLDAFQLRDYVAHFAGRSLLRTDDPPEIVPLTNCTDMFPCPVRTWGLLAHGRVLVAQPWDAAWHCIDLRSQLEPTDDPACAVLRTASHSYFPTLPNGHPN